MLTADLVRPRLRVRGGNMSVSWLKADDLWLQTAAELIQLFQAQVGQFYAHWEQALEAYEGHRTDYIIIRGLAKVLEDAATFTALDMPIDPAVLRQKLFTAGPTFAQGDLFLPARADVLQKTAVEFGLTTDLLETLLYSDRPAQYLLTQADTLWTPEDLVARYNLELARGVLYWCSQMHIEIHDNYKDFWHFLKLFKLMFWATPIPGGGYSVTLDGPISPFVRSTTRYGRQFAAFLPALFLSERWSMTADIQQPGSGRKLQYRLDHKTPLKSHFKKSGLFDSHMEADFAADFESKFGGERGQWSLTREDEVLLLGDTVMIPDFAAVHKKDGRRALIEIVGFWHPEYLNRKVEKVRAANRADLILLVYEGVNLTADRLISVPGEVLYFPNKPVVKNVMEAIERSAIPPT